VSTPDGECRQRDLTETQCGAHRIADHSVFDILEGTDDPLEELAGQDVAALDRSESANDVELYKFLSRSAGRIP